MTSVTTHEFPCLVGGVPVSLDFAPSVLFFVLYALLTLAIVWRIINPRTRTFVLIGTTIFSVERAIVHALRAKAAHDTSFRQNLTLETYFQMVYSGGFLSLGQDLTMLTRTLLVNATEPATDEESASSDKLACDDFEDHLKIRTWIRRWLGATSIMLWVSFALSIIAGAAYYKQAIRSGTHSALEQQLRLWLIEVCACTAIALLLIGLPLGALCVIPRVQKTSIFWLVAMVSFLTVVCIYRLVAMNNWTTSLESSAPGSLNSPDAKAVCYVLHIAPECLSAALLVGLNVRRVFATGLWGDISSLRPRRS